MFCILEDLHGPVCKEGIVLMDDEYMNAMQGTVAARRHAASVLRRDENVNKVFGPLAERYRDRDGGYTRVVRTRKRRDDAAQLAFIEYIDRPGELRTPRQGRTKGNMFASPAAKAAAAAATGR